MTEYRKAVNKAVPVHETKYDKIIIKLTGNKYKSQPGSGRNAVFKHITDKMTVSELIAKSAADGFDPKFVYGSVLKHKDGKDPYFTLEAPAGTTLKEIMSTRSARMLTPEQKAAKEAKAKEAADKKVAKAKAKEEARVAEEKKRQEKADAKAKEKAEKAATDAKDKAAKDAKKAEEAKAAAPNAPKPQMAPKVAAKVAGLKK